MTQAKLKRMFKQVAGLAGTAVIAIMLFRAGKTSKATGMTYWAALQSEFKAIFNLG